MGDVKNIAEINAANRELHPGQSSIAKAVNDMRGTSRSKKSVFVRGVRSMKPESERERVEEVTLCIYIYILRNANVSRRKQGRLAGVMS